MDLDLAFKILEIEQSADISEIRRAYHDLAEIWHPDKYAHNPRLAEKAAAKMKEINCAYDVIQEHLRKNRSTFKESPSNETEEEELFDFVDCINCGTTNRVSKNISNTTLKCGHCGKNPREKETQFENEYKSADSADSFEENHSKSNTNKDSANTKNIRVLRPALVASLIAFILGFSNARPPGHSDGGKALAFSLSIGIAYFLMTFMIVASWQGLRQYFSNPVAKASSRKYIFGSFTPPVSKEDAYVAINGYGWAIVISTGFSSVLAIYLGNIVSGLMEFVLVGGLVLIVWHCQSRIAAVGLLFLTMAGLIATGHNRFFGGEGGRNMIWVFFMVWASVQLVIATFRTHNLEDNLGAAKRSDNHAVNGGIWGFPKTPVILSFLVVGTILVLAFPELKKGYLSDEEVYGNKAVIHSVTPAQKPIAPAIDKAQGGGVESKDKTPFDEFIPPGYMPPQNNDIKRGTKSASLATDQFIQGEKTSSYSPDNPFAKYVKPATEQVVSEKELNGLPSKSQNATTISTEWRHKAIELGEKNDWPGLLNHALRWTQAQPGDADAWFSLGLAYGQSNQTDKAIEAYQQAIRIKPDLSEAWYSLGLYYGQSNQTAKAIEAYQQAIRIEPDYSEAWYNLGVAYREFNQTAKAIEACQQAIRIKPDYADAWNNLGFAYGQSNQTAKAIEAYRQVIRIEPDDAYAWNHLGVAYGQSNQTAKAIEACQQAIRIKPDYSEAWNNLGVAYGQSNQKAKAIEAHQQAIRIEPDYSEAWYNLGVAYRESNQTAKAIEACQQAIRIKPDYSEAWYNLGVAHRKSNQTAKVMEVYNRLKILDPNLADAFFNKVVRP